MEWISVKERLPKPCEEVLLYNISHEQHIGWLASGEFFFVDIKGTIETKPTHWMPLPEPPKDGE